MTREDTGLPRFEDRVGELAEINPGDLNGYLFVMCADDGLEVWSGSRWDDLDFLMLAAAMEKFSADYDKDGQDPSFAEVAERAIATFREYASRAGALGYTIQEDDG